jgi:predicted RNA-binding Zn ribbon-like protein
MNDTQTQEKTIYSPTGGWLALDFHNTVQGYHLHEPSYDYFQTYADLATWARQAELVDSDEERWLNDKAERDPGRAESVLQRARTLREAMHRVFSAASAGLPQHREWLGKLNHEIARAMSQARIEPTPLGYEWRWPDFPNELESLLWPVAKSAADLLTSEKLDRVRECAGDTCGWLFIDASKNRSRRWCDMRDCGNTAKARRYYQRKKAER